MVAADRGDPPLWADVDVELDVVDRNNKPPLWDLAIYGPIFVKENVTVGTVVTSVKARSVATNEHRQRGARDPVSTNQLPFEAKFHTLHPKLDICHSEMSRLSSIVPPDLHNMQMRCKFDCEIWPAAIL